MPRKSTPKGPRKAIPADQTNSETKPLVRYPMMKHLVEVEPMNQNQFNEILTAHRKFIESGGGGGSWQTFIAGEGETGIILGIYRNPGTGTGGGKQAELNHKLLTGLKMKEVFLPYANLCGVSSPSQDWSGVNLKGSLMTDADLKDCNLQNTNLSGADLSRSDLCNCNLQNADLSNTDLEEADLTGADLRGAVLDGTKFKNTRMVDAKK